MAIGKIVQIEGPVVDVKFNNSKDIPGIKAALETTVNDRRCVMEVASHLGGDVVRCIMLAPSEGLHRDMEVTTEGVGIKVPVGDKNLGRLFNEGMAER